MSVDSTPRKQRVRSDLFWMILLTAGGFFVRAGVSFLPGHDVDMGCFTAWSRDVFERGFGGFFRDGYFCDYPPFYLYVLWLVGFLRHFVPPEVVPSVVKLPSVLGDIVLSLLLWKLASVRLGRSHRLLFFGVLMIYPPFVLNGALWGQVDCLVALLCLATAMHLRAGRLVVAGAVFGAAMALKPQSFSCAGMFVPVFAAAWWSGGVGRIPMAMVSALFMFFALAMPFADARGIMPVFERYLGMYETYVSASFNAPNFLSAIGGNLKPDDTLLWGVSLAVWSKLFLGLALGAGFVCAAKRRGGVFADPLVAGAYCSMAFFYFASRMHERYSFLAMTLMLAAWLVSGDRRLLLAHLVLAATFFVNVLQVYLMSLDKKYHIASDDVFLIFLSWLNVVPFLLSGWTLLLPKRGDGVVQTGGFEEAAPLPDGVVRERRKLAVAVGVLLFVSGFLFFWRLGSTKAPVTEWVAKSAPIVTLDLGKKQYIAAVMVFAGPEHNGSLNIETSDDGRVFTHRVFIDKPWVFKWEQRVLGVEARYVRVKARDPATRLMELVLQDDSANPIPVISVDPPGADEIADEPQTAPALAYSYNSSFFDEIYFARTAYEHLKELPIYENTHPPFGKVVISGGIALFGLSPFSWRLPGALLGVVSGVLALLLARAVFRSTSAGFVAGVLFGLDGLLISQSRIATVDAQIVAYTLAAFCFGWWFYCCHLAEGWRRSWWKLVLAWVFFGLAGATKWNGFFSGPALLLLTTTPWWQALLEKNKNWWIENRWKMLLVPVIAFASALWVYFLTYVFVLSDRQGRDWRWVLQQPKYIYSYHSGGALEHPFSSPWWSWLLTLKGVWQHTDNVAGMTMDRVSMGNPFVYWAAALALPVFFLIAVIRLFKKRDMSAALIVAAFVSCLAPWIFVGRSTFLYHFLPALPFYVMMLVGVVWYATEHDRTGILRRLAATIVLIMALAGTILFYPLQAGLPTESTYRQAVRWLNSSEQNRAWFGWSWSN